MKNRKAPLRVLVPAAAVCVLILAMVFASGSNVTSTDPLVTVSYLTGNFKNQIMQQVQAAVDTKAAQLENTLTQRITAFQRAGSTQAAAAATHTAVPIAANASYVAPMNSEFLFLSGSAVAKGAGLSDLTTGSVVAIGETLQQSHLYAATTAVTIQASEAARILIRK